MQFMKQGEEMQINNMAEYITSFLNIKSDNPYLIDDMFEELESISDLKAFKDYLKAKVSTEEYKYVQGGYQKFIKAVRAFNENNKPELTQIQHDKVVGYCEALWNKTLYIFDEVDYRTQTGHELSSDAIGKFININFKEKELKVLSCIGKRSKLLAYSKRDRDGLRDKIYAAVTNLTLNKDSSLQIENKEEVLSLVDLKNKAKIKGKQ